MISLRLNKNMYYEISDNNEVIPIEMLIDEFHLNIKNKI